MNGIIKQVLFYLLLCFLPSLLFAQAALSVNLISNMIFPVQVQGIAATVVLAPNDPGAASFSITGEPNRVLSCSVISNNVKITTPGGGGAKYRIRVDSFLIQGCTHLDPTGVLHGVSVGARARIKKNNEEGEYSGINKFLVVYN
jgi:hypothetical protein